MDETAQLSYDSGFDIQPTLFEIYIDEINVTETAIPNRYRTKAVQDGVTLTRRVEDLYAVLYTYASDIGDRVKKTEFDLETLVDLGFLLRVMEHKFDELRKDLKARKEIVGKLVAYVAYQNALAADANGTKVDMTVRGQLAIGIPEQRMSASPPKKGSPEYNTFLRSLGISEEMIKDQILVPAWKGIETLVSKLTMEGRKLPPGLGKTYPQFKTTFRRQPESEIAFSDDSTDTD